MHTIQRLWIHENHICELRIKKSESVLRSNEHYLSSSEVRPEKNSGLYGIWTHDLCDTGAVLYQLS